jgi:hypothetical protein
MTNRRPIALVAIVAWSVLVFPGVVFANSQPRKMFRIENGENRIDLIGDGTPSLVISGHRENFNAHSFDVVSFYVRVDLDGKKQWLLVPITNSKSKEWDEKFNLFVGGGADCLLNDYRLLVPSGDEPTTLLIAKRAKGDFAERAPVTFSYYTLVHQTDIEPGNIPYAFDLSRVSTSKANYCDVDEAMRTELGLGNP